MTTPSLEELLTLEPPEDAHPDAAIKLSVTDLRALVALAREAQQRTVTILGPCAGERLQFSLACHIDPDEPTGLAANELATELLELVDGLTTFQAAMLTEHVRELRAKFKPGEEATT